MTREELEKITTRAINIGSAIRPGTPSWSYSDTKMYTRLMPQVPISQKDAEAMVRTTIETAIRGLQELLDKFPPERKAEPKSLSKAALI